MIASAISQLWAARFACAILHPQTWNVQKWHMPRNFILWAPNIQPDVHPRTSVRGHRGAASGLSVEAAASWRATELENNPVRVSAEEGG